MLDRQKGKFVVECYGCENTLETNTGDFHRAREVMKEEDWHAILDEGEWEHWCPGCWLKRAAAKGFSR